MRDFSGFSGILKEFVWLETLNKIGWKIRAAMISNWRFCVDEFPELEYLFEAADYLHLLSICSKIGGRGRK